MILNNNALVIGNGESRLGCDISKLTYYKIGCNAIYRDFKVDCLVCVDKKMAIEAVDANYHKDSFLYTRKDWWIRMRLLENVKPVPELPYKGTERHDNAWHWGSGPYAVLLAAKMPIKTIHLLGFDLYSQDKHVNNIYKGTKNYSNIESRATDHRYWIYQIAKVFECFPNKKFIVHNNNWTAPDLWKKSNVFLDSISNL